MSTPGFFCLLACLAITSAAGDGPRLLESRTPKSALGPSANIRVDVAMTLVPVAVQDINGHNIVGLTQDNFRVFDEAEQRPIVSFSRQDAPVSIGIVFDCSRSMSSKLKLAREAPRDLFRQLNPEDETFLVTVGSRAELRQDFTSNFGGISSDVLFSQPQGDTALIDGIYLALTHLAKSHNPRRILIVISDGGDNNSRYTLHELEAIAKEADAQIFSICLYENANSPEEAAGPDLLRKLAEASGGIPYLVSDAAVMQTVFSHIGATVHNEYVLGYYPPDDSPTGKYRKIKVRLALPKGAAPLQVHARKGYYAPER